MPGILWHDMTPEEIRQLQPCPDCGLPMLSDPENGGIDFCVYCTWMLDEQTIMTALSSKLRRDICYITPAIRKIASPEMHTLAEAKTLAQQILDYLKLTGSGL